MTEPTPDQRVPVPGSERVAPTDTGLGAADPAEVTTVTVYLRRRAALPEGSRLSREELAAAHGAADEDLTAVRAFAGEHGLEVVEADAARRAVVLRGSVGDLAAAFGTTLERFTGEAGEYRARRGPLTVPASLGPLVTGVYGLDERPQARPRLRRPSTAAPVAYTPTAVAGAYSFPAGTDGSGQCVALVELGGGFRPADLQAYFSGLGQAVPDVTAVGVDGGTNAPGAASGPDGEVMLDIEVVGAVAPGARIAVYFAPNTDQGFLDAVTTAVHDATHRPSVVSISWGGPENSWTAQAMQQMEDAFASAAALGVTVTVAAGDNGSTDGVSDGGQHVDFPASAPHALACGGTTLELSGTAISSEVVWDDLAAGGGATGGGVSSVFSLPSWQSSAGVPAPAGGSGGRGVPDVAGDADPDTGYRVRVDGQDEVIGGTSAVAPLWAGLVARLNQALGRDVGFVTPQLYPLAPQAFRDITSGSNGAWSAGPGWDPCTGLGSPDGAAILRGLGGH